MTRPSREDLLGYLLGALDEAERQTVESQLARNQPLREELHELGRRLQNLGLDGEHQEEPPPLCLAARTCEFVETIIDHSEQPSCPASSSPCPAMPPSAAPATGLSPSLRVAGEQAGRFRWVDLLVAVAAVLLIAFLSLPALNNSRFQAQVNLCQNQLRELGVALHKHSELDPLRRFPWVEARGNRAVAGIYAPTLVDRKLVMGERLFVCPSSPLAKNLDGWAVPSLAEIDAAADELLGRYHAAMGGSFGYSLGYADQGDLQPVRDQRRTNYPLLADAPSAARLHQVSLNHDGVGQNLLYEDGRTAFVLAAAHPSLDDDFYHNRLGHVAAGLDSNDAVLGASSDRPWPLTTVLKP